MKYLISLVLLFAGCAQKVEKPDSGTVVTVIPSNHKQHLDPIWNYSLDDLLSTITATHPQLICVEVSPEAFDSNFEGLFPPEAVVIAEYFKKKGINVVPSDWRAPRSSYTKANSDIEAEAQGLQIRFTTNLNHQQDRMSYLISPDGKKAIKEIHDLYVQKAGESADGFWTTRNAKVVENCMAAAKSKGASRLTLVYGVDHQYAIEDDFRAIPGVVVEQAEIVRGRSGKAVTPAVLNRWKRNLKALDSMAADTKNSNDPIHRWLAESNRMDELKLFIDRYSRQ